MKKIKSSDLINMGDVALNHPALQIDLVYANANHPENIFNQALYKNDEPFLLHKDLAAITINAAEGLLESHGWISILMDGLRPIEAQHAMGETAIAKANPHWFKEPRLLSPPGKGGHPRGMAVDIVCIDAKSKARIDMGTPFDYLSPDPADNPAARHYTNLPEAVLRNRQILEDAMTSAATQHGFGDSFLPLPSEWWDFRFTADYYNQYAPLSDHDLAEYNKIIYLT